MKQSVSLRPKCWAVSRLKSCRRPSPVLVVLGFCAVIAAAPHQTSRAETTADKPASDSSAKAAPASIDFNRDIRPILSQNCFFCHGPDEGHRKGGGKEGLRLDSASGQRRDLGGYAAVMPGKPEASELIKRITTSDEDDLMPPSSTGKTLSKAEQELLIRWVAEGARFSNHWAYERPVRSNPPAVARPAWVRNDIDRFILARLEREGLTPQPEADRYTLARRLALDLTGLPPTPEEVDRFVNDPAPDAYERYVESTLARESYGEHWARMWLDLARYADSAGYADDPPRTIWPYRDYVIHAFNANLPFDQFTIEQLAGDLLSNPTEEQIKATAFHRNTMTNSEGGTSDEEFRNVAIVDRVNTTFAVWMGTSMACAQCHSHKYDPISQKEYFELYAFFNNTADADRPDEAPLLEFYPPDLKEKRAKLETEFVALDKQFQKPAPGLVEAAQSWAQIFPAHLEWATPRPAVLNADSGKSLQLRDDNSVRVAGTGEGVFKDTYTVELPFDAPATVTALRLEALSDESLEKKGPGHGGNFVVKRVRASILPVPNDPGPSVRFIRIEHPGKVSLRLAEVQAFASGENVAVKGSATQSSTLEGGTPERAIDGTIDDEPSRSSVAISEDEEKPWWELDLKSEANLERIVIWADRKAGESLKGLRVIAMDADRDPVWEKRQNPAPQPSLSVDLMGPRQVEFATAAADVNEGHLDEGLVVTDNPQRGEGNRRRKGAERGWAIGDATGKDHTLLMVTKRPIKVPGGATLVVSIEQQSSYEKQTLGRFRLGVTSDNRVGVHAETPARVLAALAVTESERNPQQREVIVDHFVRRIAPELKEQRDRLAGLERQRDEIKPFTVPISRELEGEKRRKTKIQLRGNFLVTSDEVSEGVPSAWPPLPRGEPLNRLTLARWLVSEENPLTARVIANRFWEQIFGIGIVRTVEEFGSQGDLPVHPELLDWLACELVAQKWDVKRFLTLLVTSSVYRQSSRISPLALEKDPDNRLLSRGARFRVAAETIRDQALAAAGLLSAKMYGPSVRPVRPNLDLKAAFGGNLDWQTSPGEDRYRRGLYTEWRRTSPYPSMTTFDAPNREVCTLRRTRSNTPLQALVTLNDPVFVEAAQHLARRMVESADSPEARIRAGFRLVLSRPPSRIETAELVRLQADTQSVFEKNPDQAAAFISSTPPTTAAAPPTSTSTSTATGLSAETTELAAWTAVANVLLNLDETFMKR